jgi:hypothetical protein
MSNGAASLSILMSGLPGAFLSFLLFVREE